MKQGKNAPVDRYCACGTLRRLFEESPFEERL
jgi:hypothetical protein